ncbi:glycosyltransferase [Flammeovirga kamogawensis]|uniref:Glycosyltransferase n=1 Tax=Flammeovirga kamogawensis TaxID=373891 RepID=A0ABX8GXH9_9BACT|nr:glycosyltransferase [Flammeovirga kamogawensis]MBB6460746.1 glycosyltransferase involved in cell wall biosynthesis [Flammeovirga kamogawensis]QWG08099.1 glycosyltransferase [Flammeovirga kamogawensis]TRX69902.1 glycosyltransferase family 4 protein [Flammeovirga kamogawensis]
MKNTLYISYDGMTDPLGQSQVLPYLKGLSQNGYSITLISFEKEERKDKKAYIQKIVKKIGIDWYPLNYTKNPPIVSTVIDVQRLKKLAFKLHQEKQFRLVHCRSYISALIGLEMKKKLGVKFLFDMRGFWADERVDGNIWKLSNPIFRLVYAYFKKKEKEFLRYSDINISLTNNGLQVINEWNKSKDFSKTVVIPCCADTTLFTIKNTTHKTFVLGYLGSIGTWYLLDEMLDFYLRLLRKQPNSIFHFLTKDDPNLILSKCKDKNIPLSNILIEESEREDIVQKTSTWDYSIFFIKPAFSKKSSSPTKQGELMSMGIPVICNSNVGDTDFVINKYNSGFLIDNFDISSFDEVIDEILSSNSIFDKEKIREGAIEYFNLENGIKKYLAIYNNL